MNIKGLLCLFAIALCCSCTSTKNTSVATTQENTTNSEKSQSIEGRTATVESDGAKTVAPQGKPAQVRYDR